MIQVIFGETGTGKTKRIIDMANEALKSTKGSIVFLDRDSQYMFDLKNSIRFINASDYLIEGPKMFYGFLAGIAAQDFDIEYLYIDGFEKIVNHPINTLQGLFEDIELFSKRNSITVVLSVSCAKASAPEFMQKYAF